MNLLAVASEFHFPERVENWDDVLELLCSTYKGAHQEDLAHPSAYLTRVVQHFTEHDHRFLETLIDAWERAQPSPAKVRHAYAIVWKHARGRLSFACHMRPSRSLAGLMWQANAGTWTTLQALLAERGDDPAAMEARSRRIVHTLSGTPPSAPPPPAPPSPGRRRP